MATIRAPATTGVLGGRFRADVTPWGSVVPWDGSPELAWHVAADDRWHSPAEEVAVRQTRLLGAPVFETRLRIPGGDAVQRVWSVADGGGRTLIEVRNESPLPIACAFTREDLLTTRPLADQPVRGIELPASTVILPIAHRTAVTVALAHTDPAPGDLPAGSPSAERTARGWVTRSERASRVVLPDPDAAEVLVAERAELLLAGPPALEDDPIGHALGVAELVRLGELAGSALDAAVPHVATAAETLAPGDGWEVDAALAAAALVLARAGERRAVADVARIISGRRRSDVPNPAEVTGPRAIAALERRLASGGRLLPGGLPAAWSGAGFEALGLPVAPASTVSFAVRWHGPNAAVLWHVEGPPVELTAPDVDPTWRTHDASGEALWRTELVL